MKDIWQFIKELEWMISRTYRLNRRRRFQRRLLAKRSQLWKYSNALRRN